jgi:hypothetical protein
MSSGGIAPRFKLPGRASGAKISQFSIAVAPQPFKTTSDPIPWYSISKKHRRGIGLRSLSAGALNVQAAPLTGA